MHQFSWRLILLCGEVKGEACEWMRAESNNKPIWLHCCDDALSQSGRQWKTSSLHHPQRSWVMTFWGMHDNVWLALRCLSTLWQLNHAATNAAAASVCRGETRPRDFEALFRERHFNTHLFLQVDTVKNNNLMWWQRFFYLIKPFIKRLWAHNSN